MRCLPGRLRRQRRKVYAKGKAGILVPYRRKIIKFLFVIKTKPLPQAERNQRPLQVQPVLRGSHVYHRLVGGEGGLQLRRMPRWNDR